MVKLSGLTGEADDADNRYRHPKPVDVHVGSRVRFRRMLLGMSQEKLAEKLDITFQQVQKYEKGVNRMGASRLFDMAQALGVNVQFFFERAPNTASQELASDHPAETLTTQTSLVEFIRSCDGLELNRAFARLSNAKAKRAIVELVRRLANQHTAGNEPYPTSDNISVPGTDPTGS